MEAQKIINWCLIHKEEIKAVLVVLVSSGVLAFMANEIRKTYFLSD